MDLYPLLVFVAPIPSLAVAAVAYRSIYPRERLEEAIAIVKEYQELRAMGRSKRILRRLRSLEPSYRHARGVLLRASLVKMLFILSMYMATSLTLAARYAFPSPARIPLITIEHGGTPYIHALFIHFLGYLYALVLFRDTLL
ncbi:MAG: hypothetical protein LRS46_01990 [Desulfurococcales archaeon]|nr:hypothetical protein [Desulfurococcales archaeon]